MSVTQKQSQLINSGVSDFFGASLLFGSGFLLCLGLVMVASSSMGIAESRYGDVFFFFKSQAKKKVLESFEQKKNHLLCSFAKL